MPNRSKNKNPELILILTLIIGCHFGFNGFAQATSTIDYKSLKKTGVKILIRDFEIKNENTFEFDLYRDDVSIVDYIWSVLWKKDFGFYLNGVDPSDKNKFCPYVGEEEKRSGSEIKDIGNGKHHVTLVLTPPIINAIIENGCAVSPKPRKAPDVGTVKEKESNNILFPTIHK